MKSFETQPPVTVYPDCDGRPSTHVACAARLAVQKMQFRKFLSFILNHVDGIVTRISGGYPTYGDRTHSFRSIVEGLESRRLMSAGPAPVSLSGSGRLQINGTAGPDVIRIALDASDTTKLDVTVNGKVTQFGVASIIRGIRVDGRGGSDDIRVDQTNGAISIPLIVNAGPGNDTVVGGAGNDHLAGELGDDSLNGGAGADALDGGSGADHVRGGGGHNSFSSDDTTAELLDDHGSDSRTGGEHQAGDDHGAHVEPGDNSGGSGASGGSSGSGGSHDSPQLVGVSAISAASNSLKSAAVTANFLARQK